MSTQVQLRRGNTSQTSTFTGVTAEVTVDTDKKTVVVHDGSTAGGTPLAKEAVLTSAFAHANGAFGVANTATTSAQAAFDKANQTAQLAFTTVSANGTNLVADANTDTLTITSTMANGIFVTGTAGTDTIDIGLLNSGVTAAGYGNSITIPVLVVDAKGRLTSVTDTAIRSGTTSQTGIVQLTDSISSTSITTAATPAAVKTTYDLASTGSTTATAAFTQANTSTVLAQGAFDKANQTAQLAFTTVSANGVSLVADANTDTLTITSTMANGVFITGTAGTDTIDIGLLDSGVTATGYGSDVTVPTFVVDAKGRITSASNTTIRSGTTSQTGIVQLTDSISSTSTTTAGTPASIKTAYDLASTGSTTATAAFAHANGAFGVANTATTSAQAAFDKANQTAQLAFTTVSANGTNLVADANTDTLTITTAAANGIFITGTAGTDTIDIGLLDSGVTATGYGDSVSVPTFVVDTKGRLTSASNTAIRSGTTSQTGIVQLTDSISSTSTTTAATPAAVKSAYDLATTTSTTASAAFAHANGAFGVANSATTTAQAAFNTANTKFNSAGGAISGDVSVTGNLTVIGQTVYANTSTILIADNIVTLNAAINQAAAPAVNAGLEVDRGSSANVALLWNETSDTWTFTNDGTTYYDISNGIIADASITTAKLASTTGTGAVVLATSPTLVTPALGTPVSGVMTNCTGLPTAGLVDSAVTTIKIADSAITTAKLSTSGVTASGYGDSITIPVVVVDATGRLTNVANTTIRSGTTSQTGVIQLIDSVSSTSTTTAAAPNAVKTAYDHAGAAFAAANTAATEPNALAFAIALG